VAAGLVGRSGADLRVLTLVWTQLVRMAATAWRLTHLIVEDDFPPDPVGSAAAGRRSAGVGGRPRLVLLVRWVWIAAVVVLGAEQVGNVPRPWFQVGFVAAAVPVIEAIVGGWNGSRPPLPRPRRPPTNGREGRCA
jgi:hypothetical protein